MHVAIAGDLEVLVPVKRRKLLQTHAADDAPICLTERSVSSATRAERIVTVTTGVAHGYEVGETARMSGANEAVFNLPFRLLTVPSPTTFTYQLDPFVAGAEPPAAASGATILVQADIWVRDATLYGRKGVRTDNVGTVWLGAGSVDNDQWVKVTLGGEVWLPVAVGCRENLRNWFLDPETADDGVLVSFH